MALRRTEYGEPEEEEHRRTGLIWAAVVAALLLVIGAAAYAIVFLGKDKGPTMVRVPSSLIGASADAASSAIKNAGLQPRPGPDVTGPCDGGQRVNKGFVCQVQPREGVSVQKGSTVTYHLYTPARVDVPPVQGDKLADAQHALNQARLSWTVHRVNRAAPQGTVVRQNPEPYTSVAPGTKVDLYVSTGRVHLPDVRGLSYDDALAKLNPTFLNVTQGPPQSTNDPNKNGLVFRQNPTPGFAYPPDTKITLILYTYTPPTTPTTPTPTTTTPATTPPTTPPTSPPTTTPGG